MSKGHAARLGSLTRGIVAAGVAFGAALASIVVSATPAFASTFSTQVVISFPGPQINGVDGNPWAEQSLTVIATVTLTSNGTAVPGGTVNLSDSQGWLSGCSAQAVNPATGQATCSIATVPSSASDSITATFSGFTGSGNTYTSSLAGTTITPDPTQTQTTISNPSAFYGQSVTISTTTTAPNATAGHNFPDGGTVAFSDSAGNIPTSGVGSCAAVPVNTITGVASCSFVAVVPGADTITGVYNGDSDYGSSSNGRPLTVQRATPTASSISMTDNTHPSLGYLQPGDSVTLSSTVAPPSGSTYSEANGGNVAFTDEDGNLPTCQGSVNISTGFASCTATIASGHSDAADIFAATYSGNADYASTTSPTLTEEVGSPASNLTPTSASFSVGTNSSVQLGASGQPSASFSLPNGPTSLPSGLSLDGTTGQISGTPAIGTGGSKVVAVDASNGIGSAPATGSITLTINQAPVANSSWSPSSPPVFQYGQGNTITISLAGGTYPALTSFSASGLPAGISQASNLTDGTLTLSGSPATAATNGATQLVLTATNSVGTLSQPFSIDVAGIPAPVTTAPGPTTTTPSTGHTTTTTAPATTSSTTTPSSPTGVATPAPQDQRSYAQRLLSLGRDEQVPSSHGPRIATKGALPASFDPLNAQSHRSTRSKPALARYDLAFPLLGNVGSIGDCTIVATASITVTAHISGQLKRIPNYGSNAATNAAIAEWHHLNGNTDGGVLDQSLLSAWRSKGGILGSRISGWTTLNYGNVTQMKHALLRGAVYLGIVIPQAYTSAGSSMLWKAPLDNTDSWIAHAIALVGWDGPQHAYIGISWGREVLVPYSTVASNGLSAYAVSLVK